MISDSAQRQQALHVDQSYIVQAPAGSGKTELLTQRFLKLLTTVDKNPEEVLAITFTNKAANEMRQRIVQSLQLGLLTSAPDSEHKRQTWQLAQAVLQRDTQEQWHLLDNPNRLRVQTIDSLCTYLSKQLPITSHLGGGANISTDTSDDYQQAAETVINSLEQSTAWQAHLRELLFHVDNNIPVLKSLFVKMLGHRDQWLGHIFNAANNEQAREQLEGGLQSINAEAVQRLERAFPREAYLELDALLTFALEHSADQPKSPLYGLAQDIQPQTPATSPQAPAAPRHSCESGNLQNSALAEKIPAFARMTSEDLRITSDVKNWSLIQQFLQTKTGTWRKQVNKNLGFPTGKTKAEKERCDSYKQRYKDLLESLAQDDGLLATLNEITLLPPAHYSENQWSILNALLTLLPILAAQLNVVFQQKGHVDFIEITQAALQALENEQTPTDLALCLDYKIKHILVDEFQDTSANQFRLLELLTAGWHTSDGHSLFVVGDPMQSIYRFRAAEVGLFLQAQQYGIGEVRLTPLTLDANFRSQHDIVQWFNQIFPNVFAKENNIALGAIAYNPSQAVKKEAGHVIFHRCDQEQNLSEAQTVASIINSERQMQADASIAILVKTRRQLLDILPHLRQVNIAFQAVEIETLAHLPYIQDLTSLTQALLHQQDSLAWLSILRAPWCGLSLHDLYHIANDGNAESIWQAVQQANNISEEGKLRLQNVVPIIRSSLQQRGRLALNEWVKATWLGLQGPSGLNDDNQLDNCESFFTLLGELEQGATLENIAELPQQLSKLYAQSKAKDNAVQVMTIHKAKGLEFDCVIIPSLETGQRAPDTQLLLWQERPNSDKQIDLLLAPVKAKDQANDAIYNYIQLYEKRKDQLELVRLFYVAATRAKNNLHFCASFADESSPRTGSFLSLLWDAHEADFSQYYQNEANANVEHNKPFFKRLTSETIAQQHALLTELSVDDLQKKNRPQWPDTQATKFGTALHFLLQQLSQLAPKHWPKICDNTVYLTTLMQQFSSSMDTDNLVINLQTCLNNIISSDTAQWILCQEHQQAASEYPLSLKTDNAIINIVIDRTFIAQGERWIIDYKTSQPKPGQDEQQFLADEHKQYQHQLQRYANAFAHEGLPIKQALYFPLFDKLSIFD